MTICPKLVAAIYLLPQQEDFGFYVAEEPALIERLIELTELPMTGESYTEIKSQLFISDMSAALKAIGVETLRRGSHITFFGPGVLRG